jgi:hypothetical protein
MSQLRAYVARVPKVREGPSAHTTMSIYATLWQLRFPAHGDAHVGCEWIDVLAQGVPAHV